MPRIKRINEPDPVLTRQRRVVLEVIRESKEHLTANEVFAQAKNLLPSISFATVYNSLRYLKDAGLIAEIQFGNGASRFDKMTHRHDHALCLNCGRLVDIEMEVPETLIKSAARRSRFKPQSLEFTLRGICPECLAAE
ncbi:MAG TPA: transcriptional repressor [Pyrinomonadaceae bacterium]|jgi:Fe2+ or Zn2+ uptake regulation protein|nr:transcriptional repressor [Pyrinomonadaceae bacterium]